MRNYSEGKLIYLFLMKFLFKKKLILYITIICYYIYIKYFLYFNETLAIFKQYSRRHLNLNETLIKIRIYICFSSIK